MSLADLIEEVENLCAENVERESDWRIDLIDRLMMRKMVRDGKAIWGGKTRTDLSTLHERNPNAIFLIMVRDVKDMCASVVNRGSFSYTVAEAAQLWMDELTGFRRFADEEGACALEINYRELVCNPETTLGGVCKKIGVEYSDAMCEYEKGDRTLFRNPHGHLSGDQLMDGLNARSIGRWKRDLSAMDIAAIRSKVGHRIDEQ